MVFNPVRTEMITDGHKYLFVTESKKSTLLIDAQKTLKDDLLMKTAFFR